MYSGFTISFFTKNSRLPETRLIRVVKLNQTVNLSAIKPNHQPNKAIKLHRAAEVIILCGFYRSYLKWSGGELNLT